MNAKRMIKLNGQTVTDGFQDWIKEGIKSSSKQTYDLGKFLFSVSIATIGFITTVKKTTSDEKLDLLYFASLSILIITSIISVYMVLPQNWNLKEDVDLLFEYKNKMKLHKQKVWTWFILWLFALLIGISSFFYS